MRDFIRSTNNCQPSIKNMFFKIYAYFKFLCRATNQHGVHSPFIYQLVTLCFYNTKKQAIDTDITTAYTANPSVSFSLKIARLLNRLPSYLEAKNIVILSQSDHIANVITTGNTVNVSNHFKVNEHYDLIYIDTSSQTLKTFQQFLTQLPQHVHNATVLVMHPIHYTKRTEHLWELIRSHSITQVSIDTFSLGFIFLRTEQAQEHFNIRL